MKPRHGGARWSRRSHACASPRPVLGGGGRTSPAPVPCPASTTVTAISDIQARIAGDLQTPAREARPFRLGQGRNLNAKRSEHAVIRRRRLGECRRGLLEQDGYSSASGNSPRPAWRPINSIVPEVKITPWPVIRRCSMPWARTSRPSDPAASITEPDPAPPQRGHCHRANRIGPARLTSTPLASSILIIRLHAACAHAAHPADPARVRRADHHLRPRWHRAWQISIGTARDLTQCGTAGSGTAPG